MYPHHRHRHRPRQRARPACRRAHRAGRTAYRDLTSTAAGTRGLSCTVPAVPRSPSSAVVAAARVATVRYDEITQMITGSSPRDWEVIGPPVYLDRLGEVISGGQHWLEVDSQHYLAVYKPDVSLRLAWGLTLDRELSFEGWTWPDRSISRYAVDTFWQGALVGRRTVLDVDGGCCYLPDPDRTYVKTDESLMGYQGVGWTVKASDIAVARLLDRLVRPTSEFDRYLDQTGAIEVPDE